MSINLYLSFCVTAICLKHFLIPDQAGNEISTVESLQYDFGTIRTATDDFSDANKLGQGGFGVVYKVNFV